MRNPRLFRTARAAALFSLAIAVGGGLVACGGGGDPVASVLPPSGEAPVPPPPAAPAPAPDFLRRFQEASNVVGQSEFSSGQANQGEPSPTAGGLSSPTGVAVSADGSLLFIADAGNRRVLGFREVPETRGQDATMVFGRNDFTSGDFIVDPRSLNGTGGVAVGDGVIAVVDPVRLRILIYRLPAADGATFDPIAVVGKQDIDDFSVGCDQRTVSTPSDVFITPDGKLIVADSGGSRVLIWNEVPQTDGVLADAVLGQADFTSCARNAGALPFETASQGSMYRPGAVWSDGTRLAVADTNNHRVLLWDSLYTDDGLIRRLPDRVLGARNFERVLEEIPADASTPSPDGVASNGTHLAVSTGHRVLLWNAWPSQNMQPATSVIGQPSFEANDGNTGLPSPTSQTLFNPGRLVFHQDKLLVVDRGNHRVLVFQSE